MRAIGWVRSVSVVAAAAAGVCLVSGLAQAQQVSVRLLSEFRRVGPDGEIVAVDQGGRPREIISPAVIRNAYTSFHVVATGRAGAAYMLYIQQNPENHLRASVYRVTPAAMPDALEPVKTLSISGIFPESGTAVYWLDLWAPANTPVRRIRVEAQLNVSNDWVITPMEVRVQGAMVPLTAGPPALELARPGVTSGDAALRAVRRYLCGGGGGGGGKVGAAAATTAGGAPPTIRQMLRRNAQQDAMLAATGVRAKLEPAMLRLLGAASDSKGWCASAAAPVVADPETFLRIRDLLIRESR